MATNADKFGSFCILGFVGGGSRAGLGGGSRAPNTHFCLAKRPTSVDDSGVAALKSPKQCDCSRKYDPVEKYIRNFGQ